MEGKPKCLLVVINSNNLPLCLCSLVGLGSSSLLPSSLTESFLRLVISPCATLETAPWKDEMESVTCSRIKCRQAARLVVVFFFYSVITVNLLCKVENGPDCFMKSLYLSIFCRDLLSYFSKVSTELQNRILTAMSRWIVGCFCFGAYVHVLKLWSLKKKIVWSVSSFVFGIVDLYK